MKHQPLRLGQTTTPGTACPTLFDKCVGSLTSPAKHLTLKPMQETGLTVHCLEQWDKQDLFDSTMFFFLRSVA